MENSRSLHPMVNITSKNVLKWKKRKQTAQTWKTKR
jgi:hypothetical protein